MFTGFAPALAHIALDFGDPEIFALMLLAFATFVGLSGDDIPKTIFSICIGLVFSAVGLDIMSGEPRLVFMNITGFMHGINFLVLAIGVYGIGEMLWTIEVTRGETQMSKATISFRRILGHLGEMMRIWKSWTIGSFLGFFVGILPAAGATPGSLMAYGVAKMTASNPQDFGKGEPAGVAAPEAANNAASTGSMLPMLTLGIPGSPTTAILLGGMVIWGLVPGPRLFIDETVFVWSLIASLYAANLFAFIINVAFVPVFLWMLKMPFTVLAPTIFVLSLIGGYAPTQDMHDVWLMLIFGVGAYMLRKLDYPLAPAVLAIVLGPIAEPKMRQSLLISGGDFSVFFTRPIAGPITIIAIILILLPVFQLIRRKIREKQQAG
jgi:putative tricarboxylic transport membrane protein